MIKLTLMDDLNFTPEQLEDNRQKAIEAVKKWKESNEEFEKLCADLGFEKPDVV